MADLCTAIHGRKSGGGCEINKDNDIFKHCSAVGGKLNGDKCIIPNDKLKELAR